jgi:hypothetical protein
MFKKRFLKELQDVQYRIRECKAQIKELDPPQPKTLQIGYLTYQWIQALTNNSKPTVDDLCKTRSYSIEINPIDIHDYLRQIGEFFINVADYHTAQEEYQRELKLLLKKEVELKELLGIE